MSEIPQTVRFSIGDKVDRAYFESKLSKNEIRATEAAADRITSNADLNTARELVGIRAAANDIIQSNYQANIDAACIVAASIEESTERNINNRNINTEKITTRLDQIYTGIEELHSLFDWKLSEMIWILEQQGNQFKQIIETLQRPLTTQAKELRNRAEYAYRNMLLEESIKDLEESIKLNPYDFACYQSLGNIYLFHKKDAKKALEYYELAVRFAKPQSGYYTSFAFLHAGLSNYVLGNYLEAYNATSSAIEAYPKLSQAYYERARYCSKLGKYPEAVSNLKTAIESDRGYWGKALSGEGLKDFEPMSSQLKELAKFMTKEADKKADFEFERTNRLIDQFRSLDKPYSEVNFDGAKEKLNEGIAIKTEGTYPSCKDAVYKALVAQKIVLDSTAQHLSNQESKLIENKSRIKDLIYNSRYILPKSLKGKPDEGVPTVSQVSMRNLKSMAKWLGVPWLLYIAWVSNDIRNYLSYGYRLQDILFHPLFFDLPGFYIGLWISAFTSIYMLYNTYKVRKYNLLLSRLKQRLDGVESELNKISQIRALIKSEKLNLNIDDIDLGPLDFEKYLRKTYG